MRFSNQIAIASVLFVLLSCATPKTQRKEVHAEELRLVHVEGRTYHGDQLFTGVAIKQYASGKLSERVVYKSGQKHGVSRLWFKDGSISYKANYAVGKLHGDVKTWWINGNQRSHSKFRKGKVHGKQIQWYKDGPKYKEFNIVNGKESGLQKAWRKNGKLYCNYESRNGRIYGLKKSNMCYEIKNEEIIYATNKRALSVNDDGLSGSNTRR